MSEIDHTKGYLIEVGESPLEQCIGLCDGYGGGSDKRCVDARAELEALRASLAEAQEDHAAVCRIIEDIQSAMGSHYDQAPAPLMAQQVEVMANSLAQLEQGMKAATLRASLVAAEKRATSAEGLLDSLVSRLDLDLDDDQDPMTDGEKVEAVAEVVNRLEQREEAATKRAEAAEAALHKTTNAYAEVCGELDALREEKRRLVAGAVLPSEEELSSAVEQEQKYLGVDFSAEVAAHFGARLAVAHCRAAVQRMIDAEEPLLAAAEERADGFPEQASYHATVIGTLHSVLAALTKPTAEAPADGEGSSNG